jgi:hypothetical protein
MPKILKCGGVAAVTAAVLLAGCASVESSSSAQAVLLSDHTGAKLSVQKIGSASFRLVLTGQTAPSRAVVENRLADEAAKLTLQQHGQWFMAVEPAANGWTPPTADPLGKRFSFRMENWRPSWRFKAEKGWTNGPPPASGSAVTAYEVRADIVVHQGRFDGVEPLGYDAAMLDEYLREQVAVPSPATSKG